LTSSRNRSSRYELNYRQLQGQIGLRDKRLENLPTFWSPSETPSFDFSPALDPSLRPNFQSTTPSRSQSFRPLPHQIPPPGNWDVWLILAGRGTGKTRAGSEYVLKHLEEMGERARVGVGGPTAADVRDVCAEGESGLISIARPRFTAYNRSLGEARHVKGGYVKFLGAEEPSRWNGPQWSLLWADELALWNQDSWEQAQFGLRLGEHPKAIVTTTPKARRFVRELATAVTTQTTYAKTSDNPYLSPTVIARLTARYGGTRMGRQELDAEWLDDVPGALWTRGLLDQWRVDVPPELTRIVVAIDPSGGGGEGPAEVGIVTAGKGVDGHGYVLHDGSARLTPEAWARRAINIYELYQADRILAEKNFGGEMVEYTVRSIDDTVPVKMLNASRGKRLRAEPVSSLDEQGRIHHVGSSLAELEDQLCSWVPDSGDPSPDRLDARVWALTELLLADVEVRFY
jgi:phage terminase large subunit-like protein